MESIAFSTIISTAMIGGLIAWVLRRSLDSLASKIDVKNLEVHMIGTFEKSLSEMDRRILQHIEKLEGRVNTLEIARYRENKHEK